MFNTLVLFYFTKCHLVSTISKNPLINLLSSNYMHNSSPVSPFKWFHCIWHLHFTSNQNHKFHLCSLIQVIIVLELSATSKNSIHGYQISYLPFWKKLSKTMIGTLLKETCKKQKHCSSHIYSCTLKANRCKKMYISGRKKDILVYINTLLKGIYSTRRS